ncbi:uncharacterized protein V1518DRAFT_268741 [Limtongia smithiae]|uniref:uncharacterized protein n=1 Tax=Limtongia smithiae TaxID=1125753 RepID=UPI0034CF90BB
MAFIQTAIMSSSSIALFLASQYASGVSPRRTPRLSASTPQNLDESPPTEIASMSGSARCTPAGAGTYRPSSTSECRRSHSSPRSPICCSSHGCKSGTTNYPASSGINARPMVSDMALPTSRILRQPVAAGAGHIFVTVTCRSQCSNIYCSMNLLRLRRPGRISSSACVLASYLHVHRN